MSQGKSPSDGLLDTRTRRAAKAVRGVSERVPALTVLCHPQASRVGEEAVLFGLKAGEEVVVSRGSPGFRDPSGGSARPLLDPFLSRAPLISLEEHDRRVIVRRKQKDAEVSIDGEALVADRTLSEADLERGVALLLSGRCALLLHMTDSAPGHRPPRFGLVGESSAMERLRRDIARVAPTEMRVLLRGESGSGKELVARAIHDASARSSGPFVAVNMGAIPSQLAASALFGHVRGAFSGAVADHDGHFIAAHGGTLFLDEIGEADPSVQALLLRVLETAEVPRVGERRSRRVDVRLLCATDADLEAAVSAGRFREPLLHRISELVLRVPSLRERRDDIGRLFVSFVREVLSAEEQARLLDGEVAERPWLSAEVVFRLASAPWTGNVRQLRNVARQLVILGKDEPELVLPPELTPRARDSAPDEGESAGAPKDETNRIPSARAKGRRPQDLTEAQILEALEKTGFRRAAAAEYLGIARSSLYALLASNKHLTRINDLTVEAISEALSRHGGDYARAAADLHVSEHGLKIRTQALGLTPRG